MEALTPGLAGQRGPRAKILLHLKKEQPLAAAELAERLGVSATAVRRHMKELEAEGLVAYGREQRGHGAPTLAYRLSQSGESLFPNRYEQTTTGLIKHLVEKQGRSEAVAVLERQYEEIMSQAAGRLEGMHPEQKLDELARVLEDAGFMAETSGENGDTQLLIRNCAIQAVAECLPEICDAEQKLIRKLLGVDVERTAHIASGCNACEYVVSLEGDRKASNDN
jgi:DeoR family suf operon transcriptional repressor